MTLQLVPRATCVLCFDRTAAPESLYCSREPCRTRADRATEQAKNPVKIADLFDLPDVSGAVPALGVYGRNHSPGREPTKAGDVFQPSLASKAARKVQLFRMSHVLAVGFVCMVLGLWWGWSAR